MIAETVTLLLGGSKWFPGNIQLFKEALTTFGIEKWIFDRFLSVFMRY